MTFHTFRTSCMCVNFSQVKSFQKLSVAARGLCYRCAPCSVACMPSFPVCPLSNFRAVSREPRAVLLVPDREHRRRHPLMPHNSSGAVVGAAAPGAAWGEISRHQHRRPLVAQRVHWRHQRGGRRHRPDDTAADGRNPLRGHARGEHRRGGAVSARALAHPPEAADGHWRSQESQQRV